MKKGRTLVLRKQAVDAENAARAMVPSAGHAAPVRRRPKSVDTPRRRECGLRRLPKRVQEEVFPSCSRQCSCTLFSSLV